MIISDDKKFIFCHVPKTGGRSMRECLSKYGSKMRGGPKAHSSLDDIANRFFRERNRNIADYYKFAFVRNPWDRYVSLYHYIRDVGHHHPWRPEVLASDFKGFIKLLPHMGQNPRALAVPTKPQADFICDDVGNIIADFVGRFERISEDFEHACQKLGLDDVAPLPHTHKTDHKKYTEYYDEETIKIVENISSRDISLFDYKFGE